MTQKPDFIVDPDGIVQPAKHLSKSQICGDAQISSSKGNNSGYKSIHTSSPGYYLIPIPIGLIITLLLQLFSCSTGGRADFAFSERD